jgi:aryl-alcohol dehydrogenase-like predicted oxidoreductase
MPGMNHRPFGSTRWKVSEVGLGCWQLGADWGDVSDEKALAILRTAADAGVTFFDTADVYGLGRSESLIAQFRKSWHGHVIHVATKLGRFPQPGWPKAGDVSRGNFSREAVRLHTEASLKRLNVDTLDLTQLHCIPTDELRRGEVFDYLRELQQEGKIRHFGASVESMEEALICLKQPGLASLQIIFNIFRQKPISTLFHHARRAGVAVIVRLPLASGLLSGKIGRQTTFPADDHRHYNRDGQAFNVGETFAGLPFDEAVDLAEKLKAFVPPGMTMAQMAMRWILDHEAVSTVIPGATRPEQVLANASAAGLPALPDELHERLRAFYLNHVTAHIRGPY